MNDNGRLEAVLAEYKAMREEIISGKNREVQIYSIWIAFIGVFFGLVFDKSKYDALLILPAFSSVFAFRFLWEHKVIRMVSDYIHGEIEEKRIFLALGEIPPQNIGKGEYNKCSYIGWQHYYYEKKGLKKWETFFTSYWIHSFFALMLISFGIPILYSLLILEKTNFSISICSWYISIPLLFLVSVLISACMKWISLDCKDIIIMLISLVIVLIPIGLHEKIGTILVCQNKIPISIVAPWVHWLLVWIYLTMFWVIIILFWKERPK